MNKKDFYYELPKELIAQEPLKDRSSSRLLVLNKQEGALKDDYFKQFATYINEGDLLVINDTKVIPARLFGNKKNTNAKAEVLLLKQTEANQWEALVRPGKRLKVGDQIIFGDGILRGEIRQVLQDGTRIIQFFYNGIWEEILDTLGEMPLPPYITKKLTDKNRYQTVYARKDGSAAAPTAGLHFTEEILEEVKQKGVQIAKLTLHVGLGTFRPVKEENILNHNMHSEFFALEKEQADLVNKTKRNGKKVFAIGTTSARALESCAVGFHAVEERRGWTDIFIYPGYEFKIVDCLLTNFHLPESTLIMLVSALAGRENVLRAYTHAVKEQYRFFSFGDAMLVRQEE